MTLSDGTTTFTYIRGVDSTPDLNLERSESTTAGGLIRAQVSGKRYIDEITIRIDGDEYAELMDLLDQPSANYEYQPDDEDIPDFISTSLFPMDVSVDKPTIKQRTWNGAKYYYVTLVLKSVNYV